MAAPPLTIQDDDLLLQRAFRWERERPDAVYMTQPLGGGRVATYTWRETLAQARRMAAHLASLALPPGSSIAILSKNCAHFIMADLAIWMAGHVSVAMYPTIAADTVRYILEHSDAKLLFVGKLDAWPSQVPGVPAGLPRIAFPLAPETGDPRWDDVIADVAPIVGEPVRHRDEPAMILYTSGSTGEPKGVVHAFRTPPYGPKLLHEVLPLDGNDRMISYLPLAHALERCLVESMSLYHGFQLFFAESLDTFVDDLKRARPTIFQAVPRLWLKFQDGVHHKLPPEKLRRLLRVPLVSRIVRRKILRGLGLDRARYAITGSAPIPAELLAWYRALGLELCEGYAMTEDFVVSHFTRPGDALPGWVGRPMPGVEVRISDEGEVQIKSPGAMLGYHKQPELTAASYTDDGWFRTGDCGERDATGRLRLTGRLKELFKTSKGKYIAPAPIENLLNLDPNVEQSCVMGVGCPQPFAVVMLSQSGRELGPAVTAALAALRTRINAQVEPHEALEFLVACTEEWTIENGMLTPTLKIKRSAIEARYGARADAWFGAGEPVVWP